MKSMMIVLALCLSALSCQSSSNEISGDMTADAAVPESETGGEASTVAAENPLSWNDPIPFGQGGDASVNVSWEGSLNDFEHPLMGRLIQPDKAGPELFLFINQGAFEGTGHVRGVQMDWFDGPGKKITMTLDLSGADPLVLNAELGEESGYQAQGRTLWPGDLVYQIFFPYNPSDYSLIYIEWIEDGIIYYAGELP